MEATLTITGNIDLEATLPRIATRQVTINGGGYTISGAGRNQVFRIEASANVTINNLIIDRAYTSTRLGHGASIESNGKLTLNWVTVRNGSTSTDASLNLGAGGIYISNSGGSGWAVIRNSVIHSNSSRGAGGGIRIASGADVTIINSSIYGNSSSAGRGGGIYSAGGAVKIYHTSIVDNTSSQAGAGFYMARGTLRLRNSIIHGNTRSGSADNCRISNNALVRTRLGNIIGGGSNAACTTDQLRSDPQLIAPGVHGLGLFYIPRTGSPAIDAVACLAAVTYNIDQRGQSRINVGSQCDIGAIETEGYGSPMQPPTPTPTSTPTATSTNVPGQPTNTPTATSTPTATHTATAALPPPVIRNNIDSYADLLSAIRAIESTFEATLTITGNITLQATLPRIATRQVTINGGGYTISGAGRNQVFRIEASANVTINNVIIDQAYVGTGTENHGASIESNGKLTLNHVTVRNGSTSTDAALNIGAGGIYITNSGGEGWAVIRNSAIHSNSARGAGGGIRIASGSNVSIINSSIYGNSSASAGGGIYIAGGTVKIDHATIVDNTSSSSSSQAGGGLNMAAGSLRLRNSIIYGNTQSSSAENCRISSGTLSGNIIGGGSQHGLHDEPVELRSAVGRAQRAWARPLLLAADRQPGD